MFKYPHKICRCKSVIVYDNKRSHKILLIILLHWQGPISASAHFNNWFLRMSSLSSTARFHKYVNCQQVENSAGNSTRARGNRGEIEGLGGAWCWNWKSPAGWRTKPWRVRRTVINMNHTYINFFFFCKIIPGWIQTPHWELMMRSCLKNCWKFGEI